MTADVVAGLLERKPFVPFMLWFDSERNVTIGNADIAKLVGEDYRILKVFDAGRQETSLIDLRSIERVTLQQRI